MIRWLLAVPVAFIAKPTVSPKVASNWPARLVGPAATAGVASDPAATTYLPDVFALFPAKSRVPVTPLADPCGAFRSSAASCADPVQASKVSDRSPSSVTSMSSNLFWPHPPDAKLIGPRKLDFRSLIISRPSTAATDAAQPPDTSRGADSVIWLSKLLARLPLPFSVPLTSPYSVASRICASLRSMTMSGNLNGSPVGAGSSLSTAPRCKTPPTSFPRNRTPPARTAFTSAPNRRSDVSTSAHSAVRSGLAGSPMTIFSIR